MNNLFVVEWENGSKKGNCYVRAKDECEVFEKAIYDYFRTVDDIKSVRRVDDKSSHSERNIMNGCLPCYCNVCYFGG